MECRARARYTPPATFIVEDREEARCLYGAGFYGHPLGVEKPRDADFDSPLRLTPLEALYLVDQGVLEVYDPEGRRVDRSVVEEAARTHYGEKYTVLASVYYDLRRSGLVVRSGLKYGADFTVYRYGPGIDHAPFVLHALPREASLEPTDLVRAGRLSHSVRKTFIIASLEADGSPVYLILKWFHP